MVINWAGKGRNNGSRIPDSNSLHHLLAYWIYERVVQMKVCAHFHYWTDWHKQFNSIKEAKEDLKAFGEVGTSMNVYRQKRDCDLNEKSHKPLIASYTIDEKGRVKKKDI